MALRNHPDGIIYRRAILKRIGSLQHYHHFLLGLLVPLVVRHQSHLREGYIVPNCGPLNAILRELPINLIVGGARKAKKVFLEGLDRRLRFDPHLKASDFTVFRDFVKRLRPVRGRGPCILIERKPAAPFYYSRASDARGSGSDRRLIANHRCLERRLARFGFVNVSLEGMTLAAQRAIFNEARIVVAQHGAALANIIFMQPGAHVIEINSDPHRTDFVALCEIMGVNHNLVLQPGEKSPVDVNAITDIVRTLQSSASWPRSPIALGKRGTDRPQEATAVSG